MDDSLKRTFLAIMIYSIIAKAIIPTLLTKSPGDTNAWFRYVSVLDSDSSMINKLSSGKVGVRFELKQQTVVLILENLSAKVLAHFQLRKAGIRSVTIVL